MRPLHTMVLAAVAAGAVVAVPGSAAVAPVSGPPAVVRVAAAAAVEASTASLDATRANGEVVLLSTARRRASASSSWVPWGGAFGQVQYRPTGTSAWQTLRTFRTDSRGMATFVDTSTQAREYRTRLFATGKVGASATPAVTSRFCSVPAALRGQDLTRIPTTAKVVALTFDAGANGDAVTSIIATLKAKKVPATFFLTGQFATTFPSLTRTIMSQYPTGNHTATHPDLTTLSRSAAYAQIRQGQLQLRSVGGHDPHPWFRFPFGAVNTGLVDLVNQECYVSFRWTVDTLGWKGTSGGMTATKVRDRVVAGLVPGQIVLMHVGSHPTDGSMLDAAALPSVIDALRAKGYGFTTLESVVKDW